MPPETSPLEWAILEAFARNPERWFSASDLFLLIRNAVASETRKGPVPTSRQTAGVRKALKRLERRGLAFNLGSFPAEGSKRSVRPLMMWGLAEAVFAQARVVERDLGAQWIDAELLAAATSALSKREAGNPTGGI